MNTKTSVITAGAVGTAVGVVSAIAGMYILSAIGNKRWRKQQSREENLGRFGRYCIGEGYFGRDYIDKGRIGKDYIDKDCDYNHSYFGCGCYDENFKDGDNDLTEDDVAEIYKKRQSPVKTKTSASNPCKQEHIQPFNRAYF